MGGPRLTAMGRARIAVPTRFACGRRIWAIAGGHVPLTGTGPEPELTSFDRICLLNASDEPADVEMTLYYDDTDPVGPYKLRVAARRVRHIRFNDLIDPLAMPLDVDYSVVVRSSVAIVVQFSRQDTSHAARAVAGTLAWAPA